MVIEKLEVVEFVEYLTHKIYKLYTDIKLRKKAHISKSQKKAGTFLPFLNVYFEEFFKLSLHLVNFNYDNKTEKTQILNKKLILVLSEKKSPEMLLKMQKDPQILSIIDLYFLKKCKGLPKSYENAMR